MAFNKFPGNRFPGRPKPGEPVMSEPANTTNTPPVVNPSQPAAGAILPQWLAVILTVLVAVAGAIMFIPGLPPVVAQVASAVVALGAAFGIASPGIRKSS
jgi:hypothetical protein